jgi:hypothetical protein
LDWEALAKRVARAVGHEGDAAGLADYAVAAAVSVALSEKGFVVEMPLGAPPALVRDGRRLEPFGLRASLAEEGGAARWGAFCDDVGLAGVDLSTLVAAAGAR